jgi:hypothetical protein
MIQIRAEFKKINDWLASFGLQIQNVDLTDKEKIESRLNNDEQNKECFKVNYVKAEKENKCDAFQALKVCFFVTW